MAIRKITSVFFGGAHADSYVAKEGILFFDPDTTELRIGDGATSGGNQITGVSTSDLPTVVMSYANMASSANNSVGTIGGAGINAFEGGAADVLYQVTSGTTVTASGVLFWTNGDQNVVLGNANTSANGVRFLAGSNAQAFSCMAFATNSAGTAYSAPRSGISRVLCLVEGTLIRLANGLDKPVERITYDDDLLVWNFNKGALDHARPLWIKKPKAVTSYNHLRFSDGLTLNTIGQHRIFNKGAQSFTYPMTNATPLGTTSFNVDEKEMVLVHKEIVNEQTNAHNIITHYHMNLFADGVLTSNSFNNVYPIVNMRFVVNRSAVQHDRFSDISDRFYYGLRVSEQNMDPAAIRRYVNRLMDNDVNKLFHEEVVEDISDLMYFSNKLVKDLPIPASYMGEPT
jgi:hypothetical protein